MQAMCTIIKIADSASSGDQGDDPSPRQKQCETGPQRKGRPIPAMVIALAVVMNSSRRWFLLKLPSFTESHWCNPVYEYDVGTVQRLGEGGYASEGFALRSVWTGGMVVRLSGSTFPDILHWYERKSAA